MAQLRNSSTMGRQFSNLSLRARMSNGLWYVGQRLPRVKAQFDSRVLSSLRLSGWSCRKYNWWALWSSFGEICLPVRN
jgi:hypothetical protein